MSTEEVTVSLSRLALAKAIKTPDAGEDEAEPWTKSIIFHQSHIDSGMRNSIISPQQNRRRPGQRQQPLLQKNQKQQRGKYPPHMQHTQQDELHQQRQSRYNNLQQYPNQQQQHQLIAQVNPKTNGNRGYTNSTISKSAGTKPGRHIIPSDDEDENDEDDEDEEDEDEEDEDEDEKKESSIVIKNIKNKSQNNTLVQTRDMSEADSKHEVKVTQHAKVKGKSLRQQPSDDEEEDDEEDNESENDQDVEENESDGESLENGHEAANAVAAEENQKTYARRMSTLRQLEKGSSNPRRRSRSLSDMEQFTLPLAQIGEHDLSLGQLNAMEEWQKTMADVENITGSSMSDLGSSAMTSNEGDVIEEPVVSANSSPPSSSHQKANYRVSTLGEMDFYQYQQQQQQIAFHNMQMQQAMQMAQIQQYQQAMQMQQQMMTNYDPRNANNRQSAMDLMIQMEQEKSASRKTNKKKPINPSNVSLNDGLLSRVPEQRQHNMSFQGQMMSKKTRTSKSDHNLRETRNRSSHRPPSGMAMYYDNARAGSSMGMDPRMYPQMGRSESPMPVVSMSTPLQPMMGQYLSPNRGRSRQSQQPMMQPMMAQSRSTGRSSHMPSSRQSTNWGSKNTERIR